MYVHRSIRYFTVIHRLTLRTTGEYPEHPPLSNASTESFASFASTASKTNPVQAFLGTPQDLSARLGKGVIFSRWSLASAHLIDDVLSDDLIVCTAIMSTNFF